MRKLITFCIFGLTFIIIGCKQPNKEYIFIEGFTQGGSFHIKYQPNPDSIPVQEIYKLLNAISASLSIYDSSSIISRINRNDSTVEPDRYFIEIFRNSYKIYQQTDGAFDITVAPLVRYWGFLPKDTMIKNSQTIDSLLQYVGMHKVHLKENKIIKDYPQIQFDVNAIAQGYTVDKLAMLLESKKIKNYMVEVGGEVKVKGVNPNGEKWKVGVDKPIENSDETNRELQTILSITDISLATSGSYRKFVELNGTKYSHTINPHTGYPTHHHLLSATILSKSCTDADALATAIMVMGLEKGKQFILENKLSAFLIYSEDSGKLKTWMTNDLKNNIASIESQKP
ncbi:MAG: FAD:protein FMN transferase [Bacteroidales bacterium]|nr:FAD:protein FMN transferase [Bacteroidales bacterium]